MRKTKVSYRNERAISGYSVLAGPRQTWERFSSVSTSINDDPRLSLSCHPRNGMIGVNITLYPWPWAKNTTDPRISAWFRPRTKNTFHIKTNYPVQAHHHVVHHVTKSRDFPSKVTEQQYLLRVIEAWENIPGTRPSGPPTPLRVHWGDDVSRHIRKSSRHACPQVSDPSQGLPYQVTSLTGYWF